MDECLRFDGPYTSNEKKNIVDIVKEIAEGGSTSKLPFTT